MKTATDSKERRRLLYRVTKVVEMAYVMLCLPALFYIYFLELPGIAFGLAGFLVLVGGGVMLNDFHTRPDYAPATKPLAWRGFLALGLGVPAGLWLRLGEMPWIGWANLAGGLILAWLDYSLRPASHGGPAEFSPTEAERPAAKKPMTPERLAARQPRTPERRSPLDFLLVLWLINPITGVLGTWILTSSVELTPENWRFWAGLRAGVCVLLPVICVLPGLLHLRPGRILLGLAVMISFTGFQVATGWGSARDWLNGPEWLQVEVAQTYQLRSIRTRSKHQRAVLTDGREFFVPESMQLVPGPARLLVLNGLGRLLAVDQESA